MATGTQYDAFISYSHQDAVLGLALQNDLERFAKPWYRLRALRTFVDTSGLAANPALWESIEEAMGSSRWFILLASAAAAASPWVNRELQWWLSHRSLDRLLLIGTTSPGLAWDERAGDWAADSPVPPALRGAFAYEPLWIDLGGMRLETGKPRIPPDLIASVAAPIRGVPKDMLYGESLRQHRRTMRFIRAAVAVLVMLTGITVAAIWALLHQSKSVAIASLVLYPAIGLAIVIIGSIIPTILSRGRRRLLEIRLRGAKGELAKKGAAQPLKQAKDLDNFGVAAEELRLVEYKTKRDEAEKELAPYLPANPRAAKRLMNHERLYVQIAEDRDVFGGDPDLTYRHLAKWVLITEHWPRLGAALTRNPDEIEALESCTDIETLQQKLSLVDSNCKATDELLKVLSKAVPLAPVLGRLVRFESSKVSLRGQHPR